MTDKRVSKDMSMLVFRGKMYMFVVDGKCGECDMRNMAGRMSCALGHPTCCYPTGTRTDGLAGNWKKAPL